MLAATFAASAAEAPPPLEPQEYASTLPLVDLEKAFWACDYTATQRGVHATPMALCAAVTDRLQTVRFGGDFEHMLVWWRENKPVEHGKLNAATM